MKLQNHLDQNFNCVQTFDGCFLKAQYWVVKAAISPPLGQVPLESYNLANIAVLQKSGENGKFQISYFFQKVDYLTFPTSLISTKSANQIPRYDLPNLGVSRIF
jgi:hypothetical protein